MRQIWPAFGCLVAVAVLQSCGGDGTPAGSSAASPVATPTPVPNSGDGRFDVAVIVDSLASTKPSQADIDRVMNRTNAKLSEMTGEQLRVVESTTLARNPDAWNAAVAFAGTRAANPPEGILVFSDDDTARTYGGYSLYFRPSYPFVNEYASPVSTVASGNIYLSVVHFDHMYARCGYDDNLNHVSDVSIDGECRNRPGMRCVLVGTQWTCPDSLNDRYADHDYFTACSIIHEFLHPFGDQGVYDHWGTAQCLSRTGMSTRAAADLDQAQSYCAMCPDVFTRFRRTGR